MAITKIEVPELFDFGSDNSAFKLPTGTTAERPTSPSNGEMRFNTTTGYVEYYDTTDAQWWEIDYEALCTTNDPNYPITNLAYYKMSNASDSSGNAYNGTATNVNFNVAGKFGNAGDFSGGASYVNLNSAVLPASVFSVSLWINLDSLSPAWLFSQYTGGATGRFIFNVTPTGGFQINVSSTNSLATTNIPVITTGNWHQVVIVKDGSNGWTLYADGTPHSTWNSTINILTNQNTVLGGDDSVTSNNMIGKLDQVRIFDSALNATQVTQLYEEIQCVPTIVPSEYFNTVLYTGDGTSSNAITGVGFEPNLTWIKDRSAAAGHWVNDSVRGAGKGLMTQSTGAEITSLPELMSSFDSDGFTVGYISNNTTNFLNNSYVAWSWKAGGAAVSNTDGTITSQVSANVDAGFSIVKWTGLNQTLPTVGHGLNQEIELYIIKGLDNSDSWIISGNNAIGFDNLTNFLRFNTAAKGSTAAGHLGSSSSTINVATRNYSGQESIAYCFHSVDGYSKMGSYKATGATGNTIVTGFRPAFVMIKDTTDSVNNWVINDSKRDTSNPITSILFPNLGNQEANNIVFGVNFLSNGFEIPSTTTSTAYNKSGNTYIFMAFAADPT